MSKCASCSYIKPFTLTGSDHRILAKFGGVLNAVEALRYKSPRDVGLLGDPLKSMRPECMVRDAFTYCGIGCADVPFAPNLSSSGDLPNSSSGIGSRLW